MILRRILAAPARLGLLAAALASLTLTGCEVGAYPLDIFPEMHYQESYRVQEPPYAPIPEGSVPTSGAEYVIAQAEMTDLPNPVRLDETSIAEGHVVYAVNCAMCHGVAADGVSELTGQFTVAGVRAPPSLLTGVAAVVSDGYLYGVLTHGQANMPSFQKLLTPEERWQVINYLRSLQETQ